MKSAAYREARREYVQKLGRDVGPVFHRLMDEYVLLQLGWSQYVKLFGTSEKRIDILNAGSGLVFRLIQDRWWEATLLQICRLTDPATQGRFHNLSLRALQDALEQAGQPLRGLKGRVDRAVTKAGFARRPRDKRIAHLSRPHALGQVRQVGLGSRKRVTDAIDAIWSVLDLVWAKRMRIGYVSERHPPVAGPDAEFLLVVVREGVKLIEQRKGRFLAREIDPADIYGGPLE